MTEDAGDLLEWNCDVGGHRVRMGEHQPGGAGNPERWLDTKRTRSTEMDLGPSNHDTA
jgi:hypothetical protein